MEHGPSNPLVVNERNGAVRFKIADPSISTIRKVVADPNDPTRFFYAVADQAAKRISSGRFTQKPTGDLLIKIDREEKGIAWSIPIYEGWDNDHIHKTSELMFEDVDRDGILDVITGDSTSANLAICAIRSTDGQQLWRHELKVDHNDIPWNTPWPMMVRQKTKKATVLVTLDKPANNAPAKSVQITALDVSSGKMRASRLISTSNGIRSAVMHNNMKLVEITTDGANEVIGFHLRNPKTAKMRWQLLRIEGERINVENELDGHFQEHFGDFDGDGKIERLVQERASSKNGNKYLVRLLSATSDRQIAAFEAPSELVFSRIEKWGDAKVLAAKLTSGDHIWFRLPSGRMLLRHGQGVQFQNEVTSKFPQLLLHDGGATMIGKTQDRAVSVTVRDPSKPPNKTNVVMDDPRSDPRYRRTVVAMGPFLFQRIDNLLLNSLYSICLAVLPLWYLYVNVVRRRWSLRMLMLAPVVILLFLIAYRELSGGPEPLSQKLMTGTMIAGSIAGLAILIFKHKWISLAWMLLAFSIFATMIMKGNESMILHQAPGVVPVWTLQGWLYSVLGITILMSGMVIGILALLRRFARSTRVSRPLHRGAQLERATRSRAIALSELVDRPIAALASDRG